jgi:protein-disulfide isomerase
MNRALVLLSLGLATVGGTPAARADNGPCSELQGAIDLKNSPNDDRAQFCKFAKDTIAGGCCQSSLYDCLKNKPTCARGAVLGQVGLSVVATGATEEKAAAAAADYEAGFPPEKRNVLDTSKVPCRGPKDGLVLAEFSDFDCPHCALAAGTLHKLVDSDKGIRFCSFTFPLPGHHFSALASAAALYADSQGKFWPMADALFAKQDDRQTDDEAAYRAQVLKIAQSVGLDPKAVTAAMDEKSPFMKNVRDQQMTGIGLLLQGTPSFFLEGRALNGIALDKLATAVKDERESKGKK